MKNYINIIINSIKNNKKTTYIIIAIIFVIATIIGIFIIVKPLNKNNNPTNDNQPSAITSKAAADAIVTDSLKIFKTEPDKAKSMLQQARQQYLELKNDNGVANVDSLLCLFDDSCAKKK